MPETPLLKVEGLKKHYPIRRGVLRRIKGWVRAVDGISFELARGRTLGLVGESGCGKTTAARAILRLVEPTAGRVTFDGIPLRALPAGQLRPLRRRMQIIFQDPYSSLNPRMTVQAIVSEPLKVHGIGTPGERAVSVGRALERVGLSSAYMRHYPHEFSGGQRQRVGIARALVLEPELIVCDEPVSALDVSVQAQIINLLADIQRERGLSYLFIAHDLSIVEHVSHDVAVMYLGYIVETAPRALLYASPRHPYTRDLLAAVPVADPDARRPLPAEPGEAASAVRPQGGCPFHPRCPYADDRCRRELPGMVEVGEGHFVRCFKAP